MKELMKHVPAIKNFIEERTQTLQEISDNMVKKFLTDAYKLPFLFPVRIIVSEEKFVNFLFDMRKELFEGKKIESANTNIKEQSQIEDKVIQQENPKVEMDILETKKVTNKAAVTTKKTVKNTSNPKVKPVQKKETTEKVKKTSTKKEKITA